MADARKVSEARKLPHAPAVFRTIYEIIPQHHSESVITKNYQYKDFNRLRLRPSFFQTKHSSFLLDRLYARIVVKLSNIASCEIPCVFSVTSSYQDIISQNCVCVHNGLKI